MVPTVKERIMDEVTHREIMARFNEMEVAIRIHLDTASYPSTRIEAIKKGNIGFISTVISKFGAVGKQNLGPDVGFAFFRILMECGTDEQKNLYLEKLHQVKEEFRDVHWKGYVYNLEYYLAKS